MESGVACPPVGGAIGHVHEISIAELRVEGAVAIVYAIGVVELTSEVGGRGVEGKLSQAGEAHRLVGATRSSC